MKRKDGRPVTGIALLDKMTGVSSNFAMQKLRKLFNAERCGHTGALDPLATGMLPICFGEASKFSGTQLLSSDKLYEVTARFGVRTTTSDSTGETVSEREIKFDRDGLLLAMKGFLGKQMQVPSMYSALKYNGKPCYEYARKGITVPIEPRPIEVYSFELLSFDGVSASMRVHCSKGTYIRTIVDDLGERLGSGAHVTALRRTAVSHFPASEMRTFEEFERIFEEKGLEGLDAVLLPPDAALGDYPLVSITGKEAQTLVNGQTVPGSAHPELKGPLDTVRLERETDRFFIGLGTVSADGTIVAKRLVSPEYFHAHPESGEN